MSTCATCKHWVSLDALDGGAMGDVSSHVRGFGRIPRGGKRMGLCRVASEQKHPLFMAEDGSDYKHNLRTAPDFGCVAWSA